MKDLKMDEKDYHILEELKRNARKTVAELSSSLGMPRATVHERIVRMKNNGIIKKFTIEEDYTKTGLPYMTFVFAEYDRTAKIDQHEVARNVAKIGGVLGVYIISGEWDLLIKIRGKNVEDTGNLILDKIRMVPGVFKTYTMTVFEVTKDEV